MGGLEGASVELGGTQFQVGFQIDHHSLSAKKDLW